MPGSDIRNLNTQLGARVLVRVSPGTGNYPASDLYADLCEDLKPMLF
jgi:hypothetical protein